MEPVWSRVHKEALTTPYCKKVLQTCSCGRFVRLELGPTAFQRYLTSAIKCLN